MNFKYIHLYLIGFLSTALILLIFAAIGYFFFIPNVNQLDECFTTSLYKVDICAKNSNYVKLNQISHIAKRAIIVSEDGTFYAHQGFDWYELKQSFLQNLKSGSYRRGGSTITQQLAKNAFLSSEKTIFRKLLEAFTAYKIEKRFSKDVIFEKYLNMIEFGPNIYGIKKASETYFHKSPRRVHMLEAVWLAHLLPNPKVYSRGIRDGKLSQFSKERVQILLQRLLRYGDINQRQYEFAKDRISDFPWMHLSIEDFENIDQPTFDPTEQERALEKLMESDDWVEDEEEP